MLVANALDGRRVVAAEELRGAELRCPRCAAPVIVRCGEVLVAHFAHRSGRCANPPGRRRTPAAGTGGGVGGDDQPSLFDQLEGDGQREVGRGVEERRSRS